MYIRNKTSIENLRVKANNCYVVLDEFSLDSIKESVLNRYVCNSILRNIVTNEVNNFNNLLDYLKSVLLYQVKIIEKEQEKFNYEEDYESTTKEITSLEEQNALLINQGLNNAQVETLLLSKKSDSERLMNKINLLSVEIENMKSSFTSYHIPDIVTTIPLSSAYYECLEIDLNNLDSDLNYVKYVYDKFNSSAKEPYIDSDITEYFEGYAFKTDEVYDLVLSCLNRIYNAFHYYINDCTGLEKRLSKQSKPGIVSNMELDIFLKHMPDLSEFNNKITRLIDTANSILDKEHKISEQNISKSSSNDKDDKEEVITFKETKAIKKSKKEKIEDKVVTKALKDMGIKPSLISQKLVSLKFNKTNIKKLRPGDILKDYDSLSMITDVSKGMVKIVKENNEMHEIPLDELYKHDYNQIFVMDSYSLDDIEIGDNNAN